MSRYSVLQFAISELQSLADSCGKELKIKTLRNLFIKKKAYQSDWPHIVLRRKAQMIAGCTVMAMGGDPTLEELASLAK